MHVGFRYDLNFCFSFKTWHQYLNLDFLPKIATFDLASRLTLPAITDRLKISCRVIFLVGAILLTISRAILAETSNRTSLIIMSAVYGYVRAATVVNQNLTISEYAAPDKLSSSLSLTMIMKGVFVMTIGQLLGNYHIFVYFSIEIIDKNNDASQDGFVTILGATRCVCMRKMSFS